MNVEAFWKRICGLQLQPDGQVAVVWLGLDAGRDRLNLYDCHLHKREVLSVQAESIRRRGKWIPVAWAKGAEPIAELLRDDHGLNMLPEAVDDGDALAETVSLDLWERMRTKRFQVDPTLQAWLAEFESFQRRAQKIPRESHPLMAATRHAVAMLDWARRDPGQRRLGDNAPKLSIV